MPDTHGSTGEISTASEAAAARQTPTPPTEADSSTASQGWLRRLNAYCWRYRRNFLLSFGASLAGMAVTALVPLITKMIIDDVITTHKRSLAPGPSR